MKNNQKKQKKAGAAAPPPLSRGKRWFFRLFIAIGLPVIFLAALELALRLIGFGYPTSFFLPYSQEGQAWYVQNNQFGWRFFGAEKARNPEAMAFPQTKGPKTVRIFIYGESAAIGDPQPAFGFSRILQAMLELRYPGVHFEVINTAMTAINSNVILPISHDCAGMYGDIWVIYMGNNEVVGPYGAGTVFGSQTPPLGLIRANVALKTTRIGQLVDDIGQSLHKPPASESEWGGMEMFLNQQVRADDPRMAAVYDHFQKNLTDIINAGERRGAAVIVSTVPVNLRDCAPFGSEHPLGLTMGAQATWDKFCQAGEQALAVSNYEGAAEYFKQAAQIDNTDAGLRFRQGQCDLALGDTNAAKADFTAARDDDTLRFRCDQELNGLIRETAANRENEHVFLVDAENAFAAASPDGLPGENLFYEHVHLNFDGNYLLAKTIFPTVVKSLTPSMLPMSEMQNSMLIECPSEAECAQRLAWTDWTEEQALAEMLNRLNNPPFTGQLDHSAQMQRLQAKWQKLLPATQPAGLAQARSATEAAVAFWPNDAYLRKQLMTLDQATGDADGALTNAQRVVALTPTSPSDLNQLGLLLAQHGQYEEAAKNFREAFKLDPVDVWSLDNLAQALIKLNRRTEANQMYRKAVAIKPRFGTAWLGLGQSLETMGQTAEAQECYEKALANRILQPDALTTLARFCHSRGWLEAATTNYSEAIKLSPANAELRIEAGKNLEDLKRYTEAGDCYVAATQLAPNLMQAHFLYGMILGRENQSAAAAEQFRIAVQLRPDVIQSRLNLGVALVNSGKYDEALSEFNTVLQQDPSNAMAQQYVDAIKAKENGK